MASVIGIESAISTAERHSQKPMSETMTTRGDRFIQRVHEEIDVLLDLQRLIGGARDDKVGGKTSLHPGEGLVHLVAELVDLLAIAHLDAEGDAR